MGHHPQIADTDQPLAFQPLIRHPGLGRQRPRQVPVAFAAERREDRVAFVRPQGEQVADLGAHVAPLFPVAHAHPATQPVIELGDRTVVVRDAEVAHPATDVLGELHEPVFHRDAPGTPGQSPEVVPEILEGAVGPAQLRPPERESEKQTVVGLDHPALLLVDHQRQFAGKKAGYTRLHSVTGTGGLDEDHQVIRITGKPVTTPLQFTVEVIQQDVGQQRRKRSALRCADRCCLEGLSDQDTGPQVATNQCQHPLVAYLFGHAGHQDIVLDIVKELRQVQIDGDAVAGLDVALYLPERFVGRAARSEAEARCRKVGIEDRREYLRDGLLDHPIGYGRDPQQPLAPARFRDRNPSHRLGLIGAIGKLLADLWPVRPGELGKVLGTHPVDAGSALVGLYPLPCASHVRTVQDPRHQLLVQGWLRETTPRRIFPGRVRRWWRVTHGSSLVSHVRPFTVVGSTHGRLLWPLLTSARSRPALPQGALSRVGGRVRWRFHGFRRGPQSGSRNPLRPQAGQTSPNKDMNFQCTTAAFTLSPAPGELRHLVLTRPGTEPFMRFLSVGSHLCARASFRHPLAGLPLPSASSYIRPHGRYRYSYRGLSPHQFMPMSGVHKAMQTDGRCAAAADRQDVRRLRQLTSHHWNCWTNRLRSYRTQWHLVKKFGS